jgi:hypothetical protein
VVCRTLAAICVISTLFFPKVGLADNRFLFSGTVAELEAKRITVHRRSSVDARYEKKTFLITDSTKVEGELRLSARVTIGFVSRDDGDIATRIIVRPLPSKKN